MTITLVHSQAAADSIAGPKEVCWTSAGWEVRTGADMAPAVVPASVTRRQFLEGCDRMGLLAAVMAWRGAIDLSTLGGRSQARWFDESPAFERHNPVLIAAASALGLSDAQVDSAFVMMAGL